MNFFEQQDLARRNTRLMVALYVLAVIAVVIAVDAALAVAWVWQSGESGARPPAALYVWGALGTLAVILAVSAVRIARLRQGGEAIARMAGARPVAADTTDLLEQRLLNVVEEMAIASGSRVPRVYVMDAEPGINAFAAGYAPSNAVVAVTRGALETLDRDELQGVIAHEFSHILNGDMALNLRMVGVLAGIVFIGGIGRFMMHSMRAGRRSRGAGGVVLFGLALFLIGYVGLFFARLIKAAVSRQREFLADAASVQFTRNPQGIAGALQAIRASERGTRVESRFAEEMSHMFFAGALERRLGGLLATHPPLEERIRRIDPSRLARAAEPLATPAGAPGRGKRGEDRRQAWGRSAAESLVLVGVLDAANVRYAHGLLDSLPAGVKAALAEPEGAAAVMAGLLLAGEEAVVARQLAALGPLAPRARELGPELRDLDPAGRLPVIDLALYTLKAAPEERRKAAVSALEAVIHADRRVSLREFVMLTLVRDQLSPQAPVRGDRPLADLRTDAAALLSLLAHAGNAGEAAFRAGAAEAGFPDSALTPREKLSLQTVEAGLERLRALAPREKERLVRALFAAATSDGTIALGEAELLRLVGAVLDVPLPPLFTSS